MIPGVGQLGEGLLYVVLVAALIAIGFTIERRPALWQRGPLFVGLSIAGLLAGLVMFGIYGPQLPGGAGYDIYAYWNVDLADPYAQSLGQISELGAFRYAPPMAFILSPLHALPLLVVADAVTVLLFLALIWIAGRYSLASLAFVAVPVSIYEGNIDVLIAAAVVLGLRYPAAWAFPLLTKVTPGIGLLWFVVRREWRSLAVALAVTALIVLPTIVVRPDLWVSWVSMLRDNATLPEYNVVPLWLRLLGAVGLIAVAARTDRPWLLGFAIAIAQPTTVLRMLAVAVASIGIARRPGLARVVKGIDERGSGDLAASPGKP